MNATHGKPKIHSVENLRGIAALSVCIFHLTGNQHQDSVLKKIADLGYLGVPVFFAISGFVIPLSLYNSNYKIKNFFSYLFKRALRIEPPYLVSIIMLLVLNYLSSLSPMYSGMLFHINIKQLLLHPIFLPGYFNYQWYQPVYYTLLIEFQFYILCGLVFVLFASSKKWATYTLLIFSLLISYFFPSHLFGVFDTFLVGILYFKYKVGHIKMFEFWMLELIVIAFTLITNPDKNIFVAEILTVAGMVYWNHSGRLTTFLAQISYSLYLIHIPIGGRFMNLSERFTHSTYIGNLFLLIAITLCIICAWIFYKLVELPAIKLSRSLVNKF